MTTFLFKASGRWPFPADMLRYDGCEPATTADAELVKKLDGYPRHPEIKPGEIYTVGLKAEVRGRYFEPTYGRWDSFMWKAEPAQRQQ